MKDKPNRNSQIPSWYHMSMFAKYNCLRNKNSYEIMKPKLYYGAVPFSEIFLFTEASVFLTRNIKIVFILCKFGDIPAPRIQENESFHGI